LAAVRFFLYNVIHSDIHSRLLRSISASFACLAKGKTCGHRIWGCDFKGRVSVRNSKKLIRVLLADDHAVVRAGIRQFLEESDLISVVAEASDGLEACDRLEQLTVDVAVLDIQMPGRSGIEVVRWMRTHTPQTGALVLTAYDDEPMCRRCWALAPVAMCLKLPARKKLSPRCRQSMKGT
jgi:CheY-like chemotaxis protein